MTGELHPVLERLRAAMAAHDADGVAACMHDDYRSEQPTHPDRAFGGREQVRANYALLFEDVPDYEPHLLRWTAAGDELWTEWRTVGTTVRGEAFDYRGMAVFGVRGELISWARLYFEPVEVAGAGIDQAMRDLVDRP